MADIAQDQPGPASADAAEDLARVEQALEQGRARLAERRSERQAVLRELKLARADANDRLWELSDLEQRLGEVREQRDGPGDPLLDRELASLTQQLSALEERVLAQMLLVDELVGRVGAAEQALADAEQSWASEEQRLGAERERLATRVAPQAEH